MKMIRNQFESIADILKKEGERNEIASKVSAAIAVAMAEYLQTQNEKFDKARFLEASKPRLPK